MLATTATANDRVITDVAEQLGIGTGGDAVVLRGSLGRESLRLSVCRLPTAHARLVERLGQLPRSGIIYTLTVAAAHDVAGLLGEHGYPVAAYTGQTDPADRRGPAWRWCSRSWMSMARCVGVRGGWESTGRRWQYGGERYARVSAARKSE